MTEVIYLFQIVALLVCIYMAYRVRHEISGLARGLISLFILLIVRRLDDAFNILDANATLILSSLVVIVIADDLYHIYKMRDVLKAARILRRNQVDKLEAMRERNEQLIHKSWDWR